MIFDDFSEHISKIAHEIIMIILSLVIILVFLWIYVRIKRWYGKALIRRSSYDSIQSFDYIAASGKEITPIQRVFLKLFGKVESASLIKGLSLVFLIALLTSIIFTFYLPNDFFENTFINEIINNKFVIISQITICIILILYFGKYWISSIKNFFVYARFAPLLYSSLVLMSLAYSLYIFISSIIGEQLYFFESNLL